MEPIKVVDKTVLRTTALTGNGSGGNATVVDILDGKIVRLRPLHFEPTYDREYLRPWRMEKDGHVFEPIYKTPLPPYSLAYKKRTYSKNRIPFPMKRVDWDVNGERNPQNRGISKFKRITWEEALTTIASEIHRVTETYGMPSILLQADGHSECKNWAGTHGCMIMMLNMFGNPSVQARNADSWEGWYWGAKHVWGNEPHGQQNKNKNIIKDITENGDAVLFWGCDVEVTPWGWGGMIPSRVCFWFKEIGVKAIYVCPDLNYAAAVYADKWIPVLPNTDAALQLAIAYVWIKEDLYDKEYIATHTDGFDWFEYYVMGNEDGVPKTPEWAETKCHVPAWRIRAFARYWATHNVSIAHGNGGSMIRSAWSHEPARLEIYLLAMQAVGHPGRNMFKFMGWTQYSDPNVNPMPSYAPYPSTEHVYHGSRNRFKEGDSFIPQLYTTAAILDGPQKWYGHTCSNLPREDQFYEFQFPLEGNSPVHMIWCDCPCYCVCWNDGNKLSDAFRSPDLEFIVVQHMSFENDCMYADMLLPVSTILEVEDLAIDENSGQWAMFYLEEKGIDPLCESRSDFDIVCGVAKELEKYGGIFENAYLKYRGEETFEEAMRAGFEKSHINTKKFTWEDLKEKGFWMAQHKVNWEDEPAGLIKFYEDPASDPMTTGTGLIEFYSPMIAQFFPDDTERGPVAHWIESTDVLQERISCERAKEYPFLLVSNHPRWRLHAQLDDIPWFREMPTGKIVGPDGYAYEPVWINPKDAKKLGIEYGDIVKLYNERGTVLGGAYVTERIIEGALSQDHGARIDPIVSGEGGLDRSGSNNLISPQPPASKNCSAMVTSGFLVGLEKVDVFELAKQYPEEFARPFDPGCGLTVAPFIVEEDL